MTRWQKLLLLGSTAMCACTAAWADFYASKVSETSYDNSPALVIRLTDALKPGTALEDYVTVTPALDNGSQWLTLDNGYSWTLPFVEPNTKYAITFNRLPTSVNNETFAVVEINSSNRQYSDKWQVTTAPLSPSVSFAQSGQYLSANAANALPVTVVNVEEVDLDIFRVRDDQVTSFLNQTFYSGRPYYDRLTRLSTWADLVHTARYQLDVRPHKRDTVNLDITPATSQFDNGIYVAVIRKPGVYEYRYDTTFFTQSDIGLHTRIMGNEIQTIVNSISTGKPMSGVEVTYLWNQSNSQVLRSRTETTNDLGLASKLSTNMPALIVAEFGNQISFLQPNQNKLDLSAFANVPTRHQALQAFIYGPRDLYRPGETVDINMLIRDFDGRETDDMPVNVDIYDARGSRVERFTWWNEDSGIYRHQLTLDTNAPTGDWKLVMQQNQSITGEYRFKVEEFLPERLSLSFYDGVTEKYRYLPSRTATVPVNSQYLYGAPAAGNKADAVVSVTAATDIFEQWDDYRFGNPTERIVQKSKRLDAITLDDQGDGNFRMPGDWASIKSPLAMRITASVYETGGRPVTRSQTVISLPTGNNQFVGVRPQFSERPKSNQNVVFDLISVDAAGQPLSDDVEVSLIRTTRDYYWYYDDNNGWNWRWRNDAYVAFAKRMTIEKTGSEIEIPLAWGDYELEITSATGSKTVYPFRTQYYWGNGDANALKPEVIDILLDQDHYQPGSEALVRFQSANAGPGLLQIESSEGVLYSETFNANVGANELTLSINADWNRHDLYLTVMVLSPADQMTELAPKRSLGISHLPILREASKLNVSIDAPAKIEPNQTVRATVTIDNPEDAQGAPVYATVALVDMGVLNITNYMRPQPEQYFFAPRRFENQYLDLYGKVINNLGFKTYQQRFGGGFADSDDALSRGGDKPQSEVQIVSFFSDPIELINGKGIVEFELPAFNGRVKWMVVTWSADSFGSAEAEMTVADRLVTQIAMPRFLAMGDESQLTLDLHNLSDKAQQLTVKLQITGSLSSSYQGQTIELDDRQKRSLVIPITGTDYQGVGDIQLTVSNGEDINLTRNWRLGLRAPFPLQTRAERQVIEANTSWQPQATIDDLIAPTVKAQLTLSDKPAINFSSHVDYLLRYPYGCLEQTTSSTYPWVLIDQDLYSELNLQDSFAYRINEAFTDALRREQIEDGIALLLKKQHSDGFFGYWNANSTASMWGSAYATELLLDARELGISVDNSALNRALDALAKMVRGYSAADIWTDNITAYQTSYRAYAAYVLAKSGRANVSDLRRLLDQMTATTTNHSSLPWMHMAAAFKLQGDLNRAQQAAKQALASKRETNRYYADYGSTVRDLTLSLVLALQYGFAEGDLAMDLESALANRRWMSTQERISLVRLAKAYLANGNEWQATLIAQSFTQNLQQSKPFNSVINADQLQDLNKVSAQDRRLYASLRWQGVPKTAPAAEQNGMNINRQYYDLLGRRIDFTKPVRSGDLIIVRIDAQSQEYRFPEALIVDLLPAGFELENQNLLNASVNLDAIEVDGKNVGDYFRSYRIDYEEYRDDRYVAAVSLVPYSATTLFYLARAVTPGTYALPNSYIEDMYRPENNALGYSPGTVTITAAE